jgi:hypothetical protein
MCGQQNKNLTKIICIHTETKSLLYFNCYTIKIKFKQKHVVLLFAFSPPEPHDYCEIKIKIIDLLPRIMKSKGIPSMYFISTNFKFCDRSRCILRYWVSPVLLCSSRYCTSVQQIVSAVYVTRSNFLQQTFQIDHHRTTKFLSSIRILLPSYRQDSPRILRSHEIMFRKNRRRSMVASLSRIQISLAWWQVGIKYILFYYCGIRTGLYTVVSIVNIFMARRLRNYGSIPRTGALGTTQPRNQRINYLIVSEVERLHLQLYRLLQRVRKLRLCGALPTFPYIPSCDETEQFYCGVLRNSRYLAACNVLHNFYFAYTARHMSRDLYLPIVNSHFFNAQLVEALCCEPEGSGFDSRLCHLNFSLSAALWPWGWLSR